MTMGAMKKVPCVSTYFPFLTSFYQGPEARSFESFPRLLRYFSHTSTSENLSKL